MLALALAATGCAPASDRDGAAALQALDSPAGPNSGEPFLSTDDAGTVHLSWLQRTGDSTWALRYSRLEGETFTPATTIAEHGGFMVNWADFPSVQAGRDGVLYAHWLQRRKGGKYSYDVMITLSADSGRSWRDATLLHRDGVAAEHGFVAMWPGDGGDMEAAWLDGRASASRDTTARAMQVATTRIGADGSLGEETFLDHRTCDCCQVAATLTARGPVVAYRDRTDDEVRDIAVVRRVDGRWTAPAAVHDDHWQIAACPVNGPALASRGDTVVIAWFTGAQDTARVRVAYSTDAGATFAPPQRIDGGNPAGRVDVELLDGGSAAVTWLERTDSTSAEVRLRRVKRNGGVGAPVVLARSSGARASGFPRITRRGPELIAAWTIPGDTARIHLARYRLDALP
ncbi:MAG: exo-alpha-sialidase [Gemmatimonadaceae bacterium]|nr:exo-alpha-sialidase [Gemmatimonadaceae bacterium]